MVTISKRDSNIHFTVKNQAEDISFEDQIYIFNSFRRGAYTYDISGIDLDLNIALSYMMAKSILVVYL